MKGMLINWSLRLNVPAVAPFDCFRAPGVAIRNDPYSLELGPAWI